MEINAVVPSELKSHFKVGRTEWSIGLLSLFLGSWVEVVVLAYSSTSQNIHFWIVSAVLSSLIIGVAGLVLIRRRTAHYLESRRFRIGSAFVSYYSAVFGLLSLLWLSPQTGIWASIKESEIPRAVALAALGLLFWILGYLLPPVGPVRTLLESFGRTVFPGNALSMRFPSVSVGVYLVGLGARAYQLATGQFSYLQNVAAAISSPSSIGGLVSLFANFSQFGIVIAAMDAFTFSRSRRSRVILVVLLVIEISLGFLAGSKQSIIEAPILVAIVAYFSYGKISKKIVAVTIVASLVAFPVVTAYRTTVRGNSTSAIAPEDGVNALLTTVSKGSSTFTPKSLFVTTPLQAMGRLSEIGNIGIIIQKTPSQIPYSQWYDLVLAPAIDWIPRIIWRSKPVLSTGLSFSQQYYNIPSGLYTATAVTIPGDLYLHGGEIPLFLGMVVIGYSVSVFDEVFNPTSDRRRLIVFGPLLLDLIFLEGDVTTTVLSVLWLLIGGFIASRIAFKQRNQEIEAI